MSPSLATDFTIKFSDLLGIETASGKYKTLPEILKIASNVLCVFGDEEQKEFYNGIANKKNIRRIILPGSHKYNGDVENVIKTILPML